MKTLIYLFWGSTVLSKVIYVFLGLKMQPPTANGAAASPMILVVFGSIGVLSALAGGLLSRQIYTNPTVYTSKLAPSVYINRKRLPDDNVEIRLLAYSFICLGMAETAAVFGLVGSLMTGNHTFLFAMISLSLASWLMQFPRYTEFETQVKVSRRS